jgi:hypothetical protein
MKKFEVLQPIREERSRTKAHGEDVYCYDESSTVIVMLERSNSGKLRYEVHTPPGYGYVTSLIDTLLADARDFEDMVERVKSLPQLVNQLLHSVP